MKINDDLLEEKYKAQKALNDMSNGDLEKYCQNVHLIVEKLKKEKKFKFNTIEHSC